MKKILLAYWLCFLLPVLMSAQTTQCGVVQEYREQNEKRFLSGVEIEIKHAQSTISDKKGKFLLEFRTLVPGKKVNVRRIEKLGYEIFNKEALDQWNINPEEPFTIIMVRQEIFKKIKDNYSILSSECYARQYSLEKNEIEKKCAEGKITEEKLKEELIRLDDWYENQLDNIDNYVDRFARIDLNNLSKQEKEIILLVQKGDVASAIKKYDSMELLEKLKANNQDIIKLQIAKNQIEKTLLSKQNSAEKILSSIDRQIQLLKLAGGKENFVKIDSLLEQMVLSDTTNVTFLNEYATFLREQREYEKAISLWKSVYLYGTQIDKIHAYCEIGLAYLSVGNYEQCFHFLSNAKILGERLHDENDLKYQQAMLSLNIGLGNYYAQQNQFVDAISSFNEALERHKKLEGCVDFNNLDNGLPIIYNGLGNVYSNMNQPANALNSYKIALKEYLKDSLITNKKQSKIALFHCNIGGLYHDCYHNYDSAKFHFFQAEEIFKKLSIVNPSSHLPNLAFVQSNIGVVLASTMDYISAEKYDTEALEIYTPLYNQHPKAYLSDIIYVSSNLASLYKETERIQDAENMFMKLFNLVSKVQLQDVDFYMAEFWRIYVNYSLFKIQQKDYQTVESYLQVALNYGETLSNRRNNSYYLYRVLELLLYCSFQNESWEDALNYVDRMIELAPNEANNYDTKGEILLKLGDIKGAKKIWNKVLELDPNFLDTNHSTLYEGIKTLK